LKIELDTPLNGFQEFSASAYMNNVVPLDSVKAELRYIFGGREMWNVKCWLQDPPSTDFYRIDLSTNKDFITPNIPNWIVTDDRFFNGQYLWGATIAYVEKDRLVQGDTLEVDLYRISREYYNFIEDAKSELRGYNPLFSGPGANIRGNISNGAIGFFAVYPVSRAIYIIP